MVLAWYEWIIALVIGAGVGCAAGKVMKMEGSLIKLIILGCLGAIVGALLRWLLATALNSWIGTILMGIFGAFAMISFVQNRKKK